MSNFWQRLITGTLFTAGVIASIWYGPLSFQLLFFIAAVISLNEFYTLISSPQNHPNKTLGIISGALTYILISYTSLSGENPKLMILIAPLFVFVFIAELYRKKEQPFGNIAYTLLGILYVIVPFALLSTIAAHGEGYDRGILLGYFFLVWSSDTFAYVFGNLFGKHRLFERISPKKSWEGVIGGGISMLGIAYLLSIYQPQIDLSSWFIIATIIVVTGVLGDLCESLLKRSLGVKDSGNILPGHGGLLDRFDALLLSTPVVWAYLALFANT
jgi:phosphatidate cytidylyltransferase